MHLALRFRMTHHVTLALACVCLVVAERFHFPLLPWVLIPYLGLLVLAFFAQGQWGLPMWAANVLAVCIAAAALAWVNWQIRQPDSWIAHVPMPAGLVPYLGPLLLALLLAKLFRRGVGSPPDMEFWELQGIGLTLVALGCVLAVGPLFGVLFVAYLVSALSCLSLHHLYVRARPPERRNKRAVFFSSFLLPPSSSRASRVPSFRLGWLLLVGATGLTLFLVTPRIDSHGWDPFEQFGDRRHPAFVGRLRPVLGYVDEVDLNHTGEPEVSEEVAFHVGLADPRGRPLTELPADQHWRGTVLEYYRRGVWGAMRLRFSPPTPEEKAGGLPHPDAGDYLLTFHVWPEKAGGLFLAEPVEAGARGTPMTVRALDRRGNWTRSPFRRYSGTLVPKLFYAEGEVVYRQVFSPRAVRNRVPGPALLPPEEVRLTACPVPGLGEWTRALLRRLAVRPGTGLDRSLLGSGPGRQAEEGRRPNGAPLLPRDQWELVARALCEYLAHSGEYRYNLTHERHDPNLDPVMDFLVHVKEGRCERHASALALMLRSLGVPARLVSGFRGREHLGQGQYVVRQRHAHVWVEALVPRPGVPGQFDWLILDPTPGLEVAPQGGLSLAEWWDQQTQGPLSWWRQLIVRYDAARQASLWSALSSDEGLVSLKTWLFLLPSLGVCVVGGLVARRVWRVTRWRRNGPHRPRPTVPFYARLLDLAGRHLDLHPAAGQTPREFAREMADVLVRGAGEFAEVPGEVAAAFYRVRFGGQTLPEEEARRLADWLDGLDVWLREHPADLAAHFAETVPSLHAETVPTFPRTNGRRHDP
jgi:hypothetical protein